MEEGGEELEDEDESEEAKRQREEDFKANMSIDDEGRLTCKKCDKTFKVISTSILQGRGHPWLRVEKALEHL